MFKPIYNNKEIYINIMYYLKKFNAHSDYVSFTGTSEFIKPNVSYCVQENEVHYNKKTHDYSKDYLTFVALEDGTFTFSGNAMQYSLDNGATWSELASNTASPTVTTGNKIMWKQTGLTPTSNGIGKFVSTGRFNASGNIMSLYYGDGFASQTDLTGNGYAFYNLFNGCTSIVSCEDLVLPATTLADTCYSQMFRGCTSLTVAPQLPATTLADGCYNAMFQNCTSLITAPELLATTLARNCYYNMFRNCINLTTAPSVLPATTLAESCYRYMFNSCTSLTAVPSILPATTLTSMCYANMFQGCTSLTTAPSLPAITLSDYCYNSMFYNCTNLTTAPSILPATTLTEHCYGNMFRGCTSLNSITCLATDISATNCTNSWVTSVASTGTFTKAASMTDWTTGNDGIPEGWTVQNA